MWKWNLEWWTCVRMSVKIWKGCHEGMQFGEKCDVIKNDEGGWNKYRWKTPTFIFVDVEFDELGSQLQLESFPSHQANGEQADVSFECFRSACSWSAEGEFLASAEPILRRAHLSPLNPRCWMAPESSARNRQFKRNLNKYILPRLWRSKKRSSNVRWWLLFLEAAAPSSPASFAEMRTLLFPCRAVFAASIGKSCPWELLWARRSKSKCKIFVKNSSK